MRITNAEQYKARFKRRGAKKFVDFLSGGYRKSYKGHYDVDEFSKPEHEKRFVSIETCFPLFEHTGRTLAKFKEV